MKFVKNTSLHNIFLTFFSVLICDETLTLVTDNYITSNSAQHTKEDIAKEYLSNIITFGCLDEGVDEDDEGFVGDPESFLTFFSFKGGESGPFSTLGELASCTAKPNICSVFKVNITVYQLTDNCCCF